MTAPGMALGLTAPFTGSQAGCTDLTTSRLGSGCTVTVSAQPLFVSSISAAAVSGSAVQTPPLFGFTSEPSAVGVTVTATLKEPPGGIVMAPLAVQVRVLAAIAQLIVPAVPPAFVAVAGTVYVAPAAGKSSVRRVCPSLNAAEPAAAALTTVVVQAKAPPRTMTPPTLLVFVAVRSGARGIVLVAVGDVTPPAVAVAVFVTCFAVTSAAVTV